MDKREGKKRPMKDVYDEFIKDADELKKATKGLVNMYKTGRDAKTAIALAYHFLNEAKICADPVTEAEAQFIMKASLGPLVFSEPYRGKGYKYDFNSHYPAIYASNYLMIPIKEGEIKTITAQEFEGYQNYPFGIYRVDIKYPNNSKKWFKLFKLNSEKHYTHYCLTYAKELGLEMKLIEDGEPNQLVYTRDKLKTGAQMFKKFVDLLYPLRQNPIIKKRVKALLRCLWGALSQFNSITKTFNMEEDAEIGENKTILSMTVVSENRYKVEFIPKHRPFETSYARMKPFLLSKGRIKISKAIAPFADHVHRCHTDSMTSDVPLPIKTSPTELGALKDEGCSDIIILNCNRVLDWNNKAHIPEILAYHRQDVKQKLADIQRQKKRYNLE